MVFCYRSFTTKDGKKKLTLTGKEKFSYLFENGRRTYTKHLQLVYIINPSKAEMKTSCPSMYAFCCAKSLGNAVLRNRIRRLLREAYREIDKKILPGYWIAILPRRSYMCLTPKERVLSLIDLLKKAAILEK